jgi:aspartate aminotransferase
MTLVSPRFAQIKPSSTVAIAGLARRLRDEGRDVIDFSEGEADFGTPTHVLEAAVAAMRRGETRYTNVAGTDALKDAIRRKLARDNGLVHPRAEITVGTGAKQVIFNAFMCSLVPGDEVIVPAPYWVSYPDMVRIAGGAPFVVPTDAASGFKLTPAALRTALNERTRWLVLCSPCNPTGAVYDAGELAALGDVLAAWPRVGILSDDIYEHLTFLPARFASFASAAPSLRARTLTVNGVSKTYSMTGWRVGYGAGPADLIAAMNVLQGQSTTHAASISQAAAAAALDGPQDVLAERLAEMRARRDRIVPRINQIDGLACAAPDGAFYLWVDCRGLIGRAAAGGARLASDLDVAAHLLENQGVVAVPGTAFGASPFLRFCFAKPMATLDELARRLAAAVRALA